MRAARAGLLLILAALLATPARAATPSPADWRDITIYQVITDRFYDGEPANDNAEGSYAPATGNRTHGGDFQGLTRKLDYLKGLGVGAVWISPVVLNAYGEYHGYAARDFYSISTQMGGLAALRAFVDAAHARGIYVVLDVVMNHMGDMIDSGTSGYPAYHADPSPYVLRFRAASPRPAAPFNNLSWFHNNGSIGNWVDPEQILGELFGLDDLKTELPAVRDALVNATDWLIDNTDCDGFRIDTVKHVEIGFWQDWAPRVQAHCQSIGKTNFIMFGEVFDGSDARNGYYTGTMAGGAYALPSILYYPMYFTANDVFVWDQPTSRLTDRYSQLGNYDATARNQLVAFLDNHDNSRFLNFDHASQDTTRLRVALDWLLTSAEVPCVYYGTEQGFDGGGDPYCREDMWDGQWDYGPSDGDNFNMTHPLYERMARLDNLRRLYPALTRGTQTMLQHDTSGPGLYVYSRKSGGQEVIVALNTATAARTTPFLPTTFGASRLLVDLADTALVLSTDGTGAVSIPVPGRSTRLVTLRTGPVRLDPYVMAQSPAHDSRGVPSMTSIVLLFNEPMDTLSVMSAWTLTPDLLAQFSWSANRRTVTCRPLEPMAEGTVYRLAVSTGARDATGRPLRSRFETFFATVNGSASSIAVPAGYVAEVFAQAGLSTPEGLCFGSATAGWTSDLYVGDETQQKILRITPTGSVSTFAASATLCQKPEGVMIDRVGTYGQAMLTADNNQYVKVTAGGSPSSFGGAASPARTGTIAPAPGGPYGGVAYTSSSDNDRIYKLGASGALSTFATNIRGPEGLAFGPGGAWGTSLYVADASLTGYAASIDGDAAIYRFDSNGNKTLFVSDPVRLAGASALAFDTGGRFGGDLFVMDIKNEAVLRVTPAGQITTFATGFGNLFASGGLAFGPDGALYVADTGSGQPFTDSSGGTAVGRIIRIMSLDTTGTPEEAPRVLRLAAAPNPTGGPTRFTIELPHERELTITAFDLTGRRVAEVSREHLPEGRYERSWDGRDEEGRPVPSGVYFVRLAAGEDSRTLKLVVTRR